MSNVRKNQAGFSAVEVGLIVIIIAILAFVGYYVWHTKQSVDKSLTANNSSASTQQSSKTNPTSTTPADPYAGWQSTSGAVISFKYPADWFAHNSCAPTNPTPDCYEISPVNTDDHSNALGTTKYKDRLMLWQTQQSDNSTISLTGDKVSSVTMNGATYDLIAVKDTQGNIIAIHVASCSSGICNANLAGQSGHMRFFILPASENLMDQSLTVPIDPANADMATIKLILQSAKF
jgi:Tfp pilus assembly protein PilE